MRVAIVGSRDFRDLDVVRTFVRSLPADAVVVSGGARGVDSAAAAEARRCGLAVLEVVPDWEKYGRGAGLRRNGQIVEAADRVVAFWDGKSRGTADTVKKAAAAGKPCSVIVR